MSSDGLDSTMRTFPTDAELTRTQPGWGAPASRVRADEADLAAAGELRDGPRYADGPVLGTGGMGKVMLARDTRIGRDVALKVLHTEREMSAEDRARFLREARVQGQLEHPAIVPVYDIERRPDGQTFFTMRRVHGKTLATILDDLRQGLKDATVRFTQRELLTAFQTVCLAVDYAHSRGVVHRDLKPANIMLGEFGEVYVLDWGLARLLDESSPSLDDSDARLSMPGTFLGTPMYVAPEQMADPDVGPAADIYSLGLILFEILTLLRARDPNALLVPVDARATVRAPERNVAPELETVCVAATQPDPGDRYPSARALHDAIGRYLDGDRELEQRRKLAAEHAAAARAALSRSVEADDDREYEAQRGRAVHELGRAVALDPSNSSHFAMLGDMMTAVPSKQVAGEVKARLRDETHGVIHVGARFAMFALLGWIGFVPLLWWSGFADVDQLALIGVPLILAIVLNGVASRQREVGNAIQYVTTGIMMVATAMTSRIYGPFVLVPTLAGTFAIVLQTHPRRNVALFAAVAAVLAFVVPTLLEWSSAVPASYGFTDGAFSVLPQLVELPRTQTFVFLLTAHLASILGPAVLVHRLRAQLSSAQMRLAVQAHHFETLGAQLVGGPRVRAS